MSDTVVHAGNATLTVYQLGRAGTEDVGRFYTQSCLCSWLESLGARAIARAAGVNRTLPGSQFCRPLSLILAAPVLDPRGCFVLLGLILANLVARSGLPKRQTSAAGVNDFAAPSRPIGLALSSARILDGLGGKMG